MYFLLVIYFTLVSSLYIVLTLQEWMQDFRLAEALTEHVISAYSLRARLGKIGKMKTLRLVENAFVEKKSKF